ncbi:MAG: transcription elongation factor GreA [Cycloclasticus sp.]|jgi:transcription elongation factor GreA|nr:MAG: transcription elongation factor GreA [Cycloclasticus sp. Phe_18]MBV1912152.1 transcription elongation factor GreA [Cycloclasticus sp.]MDF1688213.1 transcription elongation factor GreA [Cycloclasticus sp.]MEE4290597.1 transcription elongation factor GreA [Cycloclasticus sp.]
MNKTPLTKKGAQSLKDELYELKNIKRPRVSEAIADARAHGDLKENAEYHAAREEQGLMEARIRDIESKLGHAQIIDISTMNANGKVIFGCTVELENIETEEIITYTIVGEDEADIKNNLISYASPFAKALIGKEEGDVAEVRAPGGVTEFEIIDVRYE